MSSEWIKFEKATSDKPEVHTMAARLGIDPDAVVGKCLRVWGWFDTHTVDGNAPVTVKALLDRITGVTGFCDALVACGWLIESGAGIQIPDYGRHNGEPSKKRAQTRDRVERHRQGQANGNAKGNAASVTPALAEQEQEVESTLSPSPARARAEEDPAGGIPRAGFPTRQQVLDYAASNRWDVKAAAAFWLHHDDRRSQGEPYHPQWHWWSKLEKWILDDARGAGRGSGRPAVPPKGTINDFDKPDTWTPDQMTLGPAPAKP